MTGIWDALPAKDTAIKLVRSIMALHVPAEERTAMADPTAAVAHSVAEVLAVVAARLAMEVPAVVAVHSAVALPVV